MRIVSKIEIDCVQFISGPRICEFAVLVEYGGEISLRELDGSEIIAWNGHELELDEAEWTDEMHDVHNWLAANEWDFVVPPNPFVANAISDIADTFRTSVVLYANAPEQDDD